MKDRLVTVLAIVAPFAIFGVIYVVAVRPNLAREQVAAARAESVGAELSRARAVVAGAPAVREAAQHDFEVRTPVESRAAEVADAIRNLLRSAAVGGVTRVSIEPGEVVSPRETGEPVDPGIKLFTGPLAYTPLTLTFDARQAQLSSFFSSLHELPGTFDVHSVDIIRTPSGALMRTRLVLFVYQRSEPGTPAGQPAVLNGSRPPIEPNAVVLVNASGLEQRLVLSQPGLRATKP